MLWPVGSLLIILGVYWCITGMVLWWSYGITQLVRGGYYQRNQALSLITKMALIITVLTAMMWLLEQRRNVIGSRWQSGWRVACGTFLLLLGYAAAILMRLQFGHYTVPLDDSAFLPILGHVNSHFFSEAGWLIFLSHVPIMASASGILYALRQGMLSGSSPKTGSQLT